MKKKIKDYIEIKTQWVRARISYKHLIVLLLLIAGIILVVFCPKSLYIKDIVKIEQGSPAASFNK